MILNPAKFGLQGSSAGRPPLERERERVGLFRPKKKKTSLSCVCLGKAARGVARAAGCDRDSTRRELERCRGELESGRCERDAALADLARSCAERDCQREPYPRLFVRSFVGRRKNALSPKFMRHKCTKKAGTDASQSRLATVAAERSRASLTTALRGVAACAQALRREQLALRTAAERRAGELESAAKATAAHVADLLRRDRANAQHEHERREQFIHHSVVQPFLFFESAKRSLFSTSFLRDHWRLSLSLSLVRVREGREPLYTALQRLSLTNMKNEYRLSSGCVWRSSLRRSRARRSSALRSAGERRNAAQRPSRAAQPFTRVLKVCA